MSETEKKDELVLDVVKNYYKGVEERLQALLGSTGLTTDDVIFVSGNPGGRYTTLALDEFRLTTMGGFILDQRWLLRKADFERLQREDKERQ